MAKRILITGVQGFTGRFLAEEMAAAGYEVFGLAHIPQADPIPGIIAVHACDLADADGLAKVIDLVRPDIVAHLAAIAFVGHGDVDAIYHTNLLGSRNLLEALVHAASPVSAVLLASSANVYGNSTGGVLSEATPVAPANDYAVSKLSMEYMANLYRQRLPLTIVRPFNYTGRGQAESFLLPKIINHVRRGAPVIELGNLHVARDFSDVRMVVQYYRRLLELPAARGEIYNVCSGRAYTLDEVLALVRSLAGDTFEVRVNPAFVRDNEVKILLGDRGKLIRAVGQAQDISLQDTLAWMLNDPSPL